MVTRIALMELKAALAGLALEDLSARSMASLATFNAKIASPRPLGRLGIVSMVKNLRRCERIARCARNTNKSELN